MGVGGTECFLTKNPKLIQKFFWGGGGGEGDEGGLE